MEIGMLFNLVSLLVSVTAASISLRAFSVNRNASQLPIIVHLLSKWREVDFMEREEVLWAEMSDPNNPPDLGFQNLPEPIKAYAFEVGQYYQCLAYLCVHSIADYRIVAPQVCYRAIRTWDAIQKHVAGERSIRGGNNTFFNTFEVFVTGLRKLDMDEIDAKVLRRSRKWSA